MSFFILCNTLDAPLSLHTLEEQKSSQCTQVSPTVFLLAIGDYGEREHRTLHPLFLMMKKRSTSVRLFHSLFLMVSSRSFVIEVAPSHVHDAEEEEQIIALRPKADFPRCTGQSQVRMRLEGMTLCMHAK